MKNPWSSISSDAAKTMTFTTPLPDTRLLSAVPPISSSVLDVGCGYGRVLGYMYQKGYRDLSGIDVSAELIEQAKVLCPTATYYTQDIEHIQLKQKYDLILVMGVIEYILTDQGQKEFFRRMNETLAPNGHLLLETFVLDSTNNTQYLRGLWKSGHWGRLTNAKGFECHHQSYKAIDKIVGEFFEIITRTRQKFTTWSGDECNGYSLVLKDRSNRE